MPNVVTCPNGHKLRVKEGLAGKQVACPRCKAVFRIPAAQAVDEGGVAGQTTPKGRATGEADGDACPSCGNPLPPGSVLCVNCGLNLHSGKRLGSGAMQQPGTRKGSRKRARRRSASAGRWKLPLLIGGGVAAVAAIALVAFLLLGGSAPEATARAFIEATKAGDVEAIKGLVTAKARRLAGNEVLPVGMPAGGPAAAQTPQVDYQVGRASTGIRTAKVPITISAVGQEVTMTLLMRREWFRWRVYGMAVSGGGVGEMTLDFENPGSLPQFPGDLK